VLSSLSFKKSHRVTHQSPVLSDIVVTRSCVDNGVVSSTRVDKLQDHLVLLTVDDNCEADGVSTLPRYVVLV